MKKLDEPLLHVIHGTEVQARRIIPARAPELRL